MDERYSLESVVAEAVRKGLAADEISRVRWAYLDTFAAYEKQVPYSHDRLPGIAGVAVYQLNKSIVSYGSAQREIRRIIDNLHKEGAK